jgi:tetratricopeptide (TPR) repeat protein
MAQQGCELTRYQSPGALLVLADAYAGTGQSDLAATTASDAYRKRGDLFFMKEHREQAAEAYRESLRLNPANQDALRNLDLVMRRLKSTPTNPQ